MAAVELKINADVAQEEVSEVIDNDYKLSPSQDKSWTKIKD